jgi:hypothetical protein
MLSNTKAKKMFAKLKTLEAENILLAEKNAELEAKLLTTETNIIAIKDDLKDIKEISIIEPIIKK